MSFITVFLKIGMILLSILFFPVKLYFMLQRPKRCPPIEDNILKVPAVHLAKKIRNHEVSSESVVRAYVSRIKAVNVILNAVVQDRFEDAIEEAKHIDKLISEGHINKDVFNKKPLLGIPFTVKESIPVKGLSNRAGSKIHKRDKSDKNAKIVERLKEAGAIPLLVSNTPELCMNWETNNKVTGKTCNPYDTRRTCGGSSGGEAALLGSGASLIGLGSDVCGSLRIPPHFCGVWGHKPTSGVVYIGDHFPNCKDEIIWPTIFTLGPMTRYAIDLPIVLDTIVNNDVRDKLKLLEEVDIKDINIHYLIDGDISLANKVDREILDGINKFIKYMKDNHNVDSKKANIPEMKKATRALLSLLHINDLTPVLEEGKSTTLEFFKYFIGLSNVTIVPLLHAVWQPIITRFTPKKKLEKVHGSLDKLKEQILNCIGDNGVLLCPSYPSAAHFHNEIFYKVFDTSYLAIFNELGLPSTSCTLGLNSNGLPIAIQVVTKPYNDRLALRVAIEIESAFGGWTPPPSKQRTRIV